MDLAQQALAAREEGLAEVYRLLQQPEDLERLPDLIHEYENKVKANKQGLSALMQSQVEAVRAGLELLDKSHRHVLKLRACLDSIFKLCEECASLIDQRDRIRLLSQTHGNVQKVLVEIKDIIDLPSHAELAIEMLQDPGALVGAYQALTVLEGTAENAKLAWKRNAKAAKHDMSSMMRYLQRVSDAAADFEVVLFEHLERYEELAQEQPTLLVDCLRVVEMQERLDRQYVRARLEHFKPKQWRQRLTRLLSDSVSAKFTQLLELAPQCGQPNLKIKYNQEGDVVLEEKRDYLGNLVGLKLLDKMTGQEELVSDATKLRTMEIIEEETFEEDPFLNAIIPDLYAVEADLADVYDHVTLCFPASYNIFELLFQMYHINVAMVIDTIGQRAEHLSTGGSLRIMEFVRKYLETLRGFGLEEALVRFPPSPNTDPDLPPGLDYLMRCYIERMETSVTKWFNNIMVVDLEYEPKPGPNGKLRTAGVTDFFRILNEEIEVIRAIDDHGEVMFQTARMSLRIMQGFQKEQTRVIKDPDNALSLEMACALLNNNVECYDQSLTFVEEVQELLEESYRDKLEVEDVCRGFLEVAKEASKRLVGVVFNDPGMSTQLKNMFSHADWQAGRTTSVLVATLTDYMGDVEKFVEGSFIKRVAESMLEELVRRCVNIFIAGIPTMSDAIARRMEADEDAFLTYFSKYLKPDKMAKPLQQLSDLRLLLSSDSVATVTAAYESALSVHSGFTLEVLQKILDARGTYGGWDRKQVKDVLGAAKEVYRKHTNAIEAAEKAAKGESKGFFSSLWG